MAEFVSTEVQEHVGVIVVNRSERRNALSLQVKAEIVDAVRTLEVDERVRVLVIYGSGGCFAAGTDIAEMAEMRPTDHLRQATEEVFQVVRHSRKPVIAAVEGYALGGGCELALACDLIVAAADARFGQPEIRVGIMPGAGGTQRLLRTAGRYKAALWTLTGDMIEATEAYAANLVSLLVPSGEALSRAIDIGTRIASMPPLAVQAIREALRLGADVSLETALALERRLFERLFDSEDQKEGMKAFLSKRQPLYRGR
ncbi:enoyl-CoA hydratase-related protein [Cupriavidus sp. amp6]|uniref:enoyl-CoA hydratase-related protein n=1 Tax=Cupriavidus sp. amp6 TaxID=388051 RepID=UPI0004912003|nr:enoyl-CoA hydratase-related protein [Cupriavidus sp. amp6]